MGYCHVFMRSCDHDYEAVPQLKAHFYVQQLNLNSSSGEVGV